MRERKGLTREKEEEGPSLSLQELKGRQSVRATFRLPVELIELFILFAAQFGLKQKSLFDQLVENGETLARVAAGGKSAGRGEGERRAKTLVVSKRSLTLLEMVAREWQLPRDLLVELSLRRLLPLLAQEQDRHRRRVQAAAEVQALVEHGQSLLRQVEERLGREDQVHELVAGMVAQCRQLSDRLEEIVSKGESVLLFQGGEVDGAEGQPDGSPEMEGGAQ